MLAVEALTTVWNILISIFASFVCYNIVVTVFKIESKKVIWAITAIFFLIDLFARARQFYTISPLPDRSNLEMLMAQFLYALGRIDVGGILIMVCMLIKKVFDFIKRLHIRKGESI